jgi:hypothetical protein
MQAAAMCALMAPYRFKSFDAAGRGPHTTFGRIGKPSPGRD